MKNIKVSKDIEIKPVEISQAVKYTRSPGTIEI